MFRDVAAPAAGLSAGHDGLHQQHSQDHVQRRQHELGPDHESGGVRRRGLLAAEGGAAGAVPGGGGRADLLLSDLRAARVAPAQQRLGESCFLPCIIQLVQQK